MSSDDIVVPDYVEPIDAHRFWRLDARGYLTSVRYMDDTPWKPGEHMYMHNMWKGIPASNNSLGFHAYKSPDFLVPALWSTLGQCNIAVIFGTCKLWGTMVEHEHGYRAQHAMVTEVNGVFLHMNKAQHTQPVRNRQSFDQLLELLDKSGYSFRAIDTPAYCKEVRPGLYKWNGKDAPSTTWSRNNPVVTKEDVDGHR